MRVIVFTLLSFGLLLGCSTGKNKTVSHITHTHHLPVNKDGAPKNPQPMHDVKSVSPKFEQLSQYGNPTSYEVNGETYEVLPSSDGYRKTGIASWYGTQFHSQRTSSGETYDMYGLTAAHKTLPLPTYVKVKNLINLKEIIVKVNDRGPFHSGRIIDLSYAAAAKLGMLPTGTAPVEVEVVSVSRQGHPKIASYYLQAGAFDTQRKAELMKEQLASITSTPVYVEQKPPHFVVKIGPYTTREQVETSKQNLANHGIKGVFASLMYG